MDTSAENTSIPDLGTEDGEREARPKSKGFNGASEQFTNAEVVRLGCSTDLIEFLFVFLPLLSFRLASSSSFWIASQSSPVTPSPTYSVDYNYITVYKAD